LLKDFKDQQILNLSHFLGYFTHVTTLGEVKEQVLKYIPVMARPMVMYRDKHPIIWTGVYADIEDPKTSRWLWDIRERSRQRARTENYREIMRMQQEDADPLAKVDAEDDSAATKKTMEALTKLSDEKELERYLSYGKWGLSDDDIVRLNKDEEMKQRVSLLYLVCDTNSPIHQSTIFFLSKYPFIYCFFWIEIIQPFLNLQGASKCISQN